MNGRVYVKLLKGTCDIYIYDLEYSLNMGMGFHQNLNKKTWWTFNHQNGNHNYHLSAIEMGLS